MASCSGSLILGGDLAFSLIQREASDSERAFLAAQGTSPLSPPCRRWRAPATAAGRLSRSRRSMRLIRCSGQSPPIPTCRSGAVRATGRRVRRRRRSGAACAVRSQARRSDQHRQRRDRVRATLTGEPDKLAGGISFGPRVLISAAALRASGLLQPGSLVRWQYRLRLPGRRRRCAVTAIEKQAQTAFPNAGWDIRTRSKASPQLERNVERFSQFLTLVALTALLVGGVGVANAVASHLARKHDVIATMKALGATGGGVFAVYCADRAGRAVCHHIGAALGAALPFAIAWRSALSFRCRSRRRSIRGACSGDRLWAPDGARLCAVAARAGA